MDVETTLFGQLGNFSVFRRYTVMKTLLFHVIICFVVVNVIQCQIREFQTLFDIVLNNYDHQFAVLHIKQGPENLNNGIYDLAKPGKRIDLNRFDQPYINDALKIMATRPIPRNDGTKIHSECTILKQNGETIKKWIRQSSKRNNKKCSVDFYLYTVNSPCCGADSYNRQDMQRGGYKSCREFSCVTLISEEIPKYKKFAADEGIDLRIYLSWSKPFVSLNCYNDNSKDNLRRRRSFYQGYYTGLSNLFSLLQQRNLDGIVIFVR